MFINNFNYAKFRYRNLYTIKVSSPKRQNYNLMKHQKYNYIACTVNILSFISLRDLQGSSYSLMESVCLITLIFNSELVNQKKIYKTRV